MRRMKFIIATTLVITTVMAAIFTSCGTKVTPNEPANVFIKATAEAESKEALQEFIKSHKVNEVLLNSTNGNDVKKYVSKNFDIYFTSHFMSDVENDLQSGFSSNKYNLFFLNEKYVTTFNAANYHICKAVVNYNKTVTLEIRNISVFYIEMKQENGRWKINRLSCTQF